MDSDVLDRILAGPDEPAAEAQASTAASTDAQASTDNKTAVREEPTDPDLQWDEDGTEEGSEPPDAHDTAPDQQTDDDLDAIEERNKWMRGRLAPVKHKLTEAEAELARLRAENEHLRGGKPPAEQEADVAQPRNVDEYVASHPEVQRLSKALHDLEGEADKLTMGEYQDRKLDILTDLKIAKREVMRAITDTVRNQQQAAAAAEVKVVTDFRAAVLAKKEELPDVEKALGRLERNAGNLHMEIRRSLILDDRGNINPEAAELVHEIGNDKQALSYLIAQSRAAAQGRRVPTAALEYLGRLKERIRSRQDQPAPDQSGDTGVRVREHVRRPTVPREVRASPPNASGPADLQAWAQKALKSGERPW